MTIAGCGMVSGANFQALSPAACLCPPLSCPVLFCPALFLCWLQRFSSVLAGEPLPIRRNALHLYLERCRVARN